MIDWLDVELPISHQALKQGSRIIIDPAGDVIYSSPTLLTVENEYEGEGSYSSSLAVTSIHSDFVLSRTNGFKPEFAPGLSIKGNPSKYIQGHNIFGIDCIRSLIVAVIRDIFPKLGFSKNQESQAIFNVMIWNFAVTRIDITKMFNLGSDAAVNEYLQMLPRTVKARGDRTDFVKNTFYIGRTSGLWSFKFYNKYLELCSKSKKHHLPDFLPEELKEFAKGQLRAELVLRKQALKRLELHENPEKLQIKLNEIFETYADKMTMKNQTISDIDISTLSTTYLGTLMLWRQGKHLKSELKRDKFYAHRRKLLELGIDIAKPPIALDERVAIVKPLKVLVPKEVCEIPPQFQRYMVRKVA